MSIIMEINSKQKCEFNNIELSREQQLAFNMYKLGKNVFVTGPGGSGKSELIKTKVNDAFNNGKKIQVTSL